MDNHRFLRACRGEPTDQTPIWLMRQAGRYMAEYRAIRAQHSFMEVMKTPALTAEVTLQPIRAFDFDAAIIFADIMTPLEGIGIDYEIKESVGPVIAQPLRDAGALERLKPFDAQRDVGFMLEAIGRVKAELAGQTPVIGFAGAPFTLACYAIEGKGSREFELARRLMYTDRGLWDGLMTRLSEMTVAYLRAQVAAGAQAVQLFDSWVGLLSPSSYRRYVQPYMKGVFEGLKGVGVPVIHFGTGTAALLEVMTETGGDVIGLDWRVSLDEGWRRVGYHKPVQGNLDPVALLTDPQTLEEAAAQVLAEAAGRPGHIFNVGHGIIRHTPPAHVAHLVEVVRRRSRRG
jgi:uroporphyrinogen decarboxylase